MKCSVRIWGARILNIGPETDLIYIMYSISRYSGLHHFVTVFCWDGGDQLLFALWITSLHYSRSDRTHIRWRAMKIQSTNLTYIKVLIYTVVLTSKPWRLYFKQSLWLIFGFLVNCNIHHAANCAWCEYNKLSSCLWRSRQKIYTDELSRRTSGDFVSVQVFVAGVVDHIWPIWSYIAVWSKLTKYADLTRLLKIYITIGNYLVMKHNKARDLARRSVPWAVCDQLLSWDSSCSGGVRVARYCSSVTLH